MPNKTSITEFILLGITDDPELQAAKFFFLLFTYLLSVKWKHDHHHPNSIKCLFEDSMYFFFRNFSFLKILFTTTCIPRFLACIATEDATIFYNTCMTQIFF